MPTKFSLTIFLLALIGASILAPAEQCHTDTECEIEAAKRCFVLCES